ncbi:MAG: T9SS type A sorting domain-containing protein [Cryomorphaceae bacterium]
MHKCSACKTRVARIIYRFLLLSTVPLVMTGCFGTSLFISTQSGSWEDGATWGNTSPGQNGTDYPSNNDHVVISPNTTVLQSSAERPGRVWISTNAELVSSNTLRVNQSYLNDGIHTGGGLVRLQGNNDTILGTGTIATTNQFRVDNNRIILPGSSLTRQAGSLRCPVNDTLKNAGILIMDNCDLISPNSGAFKNLTGGVVNTSGAIMESGTLVASAIDNTFIYELMGTGNQEIRPSLDGYYDVSIEGNSLTGQKQVIADLTILNDLKINGSTLFATDSFNISIGGDLTLASSATSGFDVYTNQAKVVLNGDAAQIINGRFQFHDLAIQKISAAASFINDTSFIHGTLDVNEGTLLTNEKLILVSDSNGDARVGPVGGIVAGDVLVQRYIDAGATGWRFLCAPVTGATLSDWNDDFITCGFAGSDFPNFDFTSIMGYDESVSGHQDSGFVFPSSINDPIPPNGAFWVFSGDELNGTAPFTIDVTGPLITGDFDFSITNSNNTSLNADGWNLVSNPYVSPIDWESPSWTKTFVDDAIYVWNTDMGSYASYISGVGVNGGSNLVASSQGFYVHANNLGPSLIIREACKTDSDVGFLRPTLEPILRLSASDGDFVNETVLRFNPNASQGFDEDLDAYYIKSEASPVRIYTENDGELYSIHSVKTMGTDTLSLRVMASTQWIPIHYEKNGPMMPYCLAIVDTYKGETNVLQGGTGMIELDSTDAEKGRYVLVYLNNNESEAANCFVTGIRKAVPNPSSAAYESDGILYFKDVTYNNEAIRIYNTMGALVWTGKVESQQLVLPAFMAAGVYVVNIGASDYLKIFLEGY